MPLISLALLPSDTSTSTAFAQALDPEIALASTTFISNQRLPKMVVLQQFVENRTFVLITGDGMDPADNTFSQSPVPEDGMI